MTKMMLKEWEVPAGAKVHCYMPRIDTPVQKRGEPLVLCKLFQDEDWDGGSWNLYPLSEDGVGDRRIRFSRRATFSPIELYSPEEAPTDHQYSVYLDGKPVPCSDGYHHSLVKRDNDGMFREHDGENFEFTEEVQLPPNVQLIPVDGIESTPEEKARYRF